MLKAIKGWSKKAPKIIRLPSGCASVVPALEKKPSKWHSLKRFVSRLIRQR